MNAARLRGQIRKTLLHVETGERRRVSEFSRAAIAVAALVRFYYAFVTYLILAPVLRFAEAFQGVPPTAPLWPLDLLAPFAGFAWLARVELLTAAGASAALLAALRPGVPLFRWGVFLYVALVIALDNSYGGINHGAHLFIYASFGLLFLPSAIGHPEKMSRREAMGCNAAFWLTQALLLLCYSLSGFWKFRHSNIRLLRPDAFVRVVLDGLVRQLGRRPVPPLVPWLVQYEHWGQLLHLAFCYVEAAMLVCLFRPHLQVLFGVVAILFHCGTGWLLGFSFYPYIVIWFLFLVFSPFAARRFSPFATARSLPLLGIPFRAWAGWRRAEAGAEKAWLVYDGECPFCARYARLVDVRDAVGELVFVNARDGGPVVDEVRALPWDLNQGMALKLNGRYRLGDEALHTLALLSQKKGAFGVLHRLVLGSRAVAWLAYPLLKLGRRLALRAKRAPALQ